MPPERIMAIKRACQGGLDHVAAAGRHEPVLNRGLNLELFWMARVDKVLTLAASLSQELFCSQRKSTEAALKRFQQRIIKL